jgi:outer membrane protein insertion porin family
MRHVRRSGFDVRRTTFSVLRSLLVVAFILCQRIADAAVDDYLGKPVGTVRLAIEGRPTVDPVLTVVVETLAGRPLSMAAVRQTITHLFSLGRFDDVRVDATLEDGKVALRYELSPIHPVSGIRFTVAGAQSGLDTDQLRRAIVDRFGGSPPIGRLAEMARLVGDTLRERGYLHASITPRADVEHNPERATLVFALDPGPRTTIGAVEVVGRTTVPRDELLSKFGLRPGAPYQRDQLAARIDRYVEERRAARYYEATIAPSVQLDDGDRRANVTLSVNQGPRVHVEFTGDAAALPEARRGELVLDPLQREGSIGDDVLDYLTNQIEEFFRAQGYLDVAAPHTRGEGADELTIRFEIKRGLQHRIESAQLAGNANVSSEQFEPVVRLLNGQPWSATRLAVAGRMVGDLYRSLGYAAVRVSPADEPLPADSVASPSVVGHSVRIVVDEGPKTTISAVTFSGNNAIDDARLRARAGVQPASPYVADRLETARAAILTMYRDLGYENAAVAVTPQSSDDPTRVAVAFAIREGPQVLVDHVLIVGNVRTATETIERELQVKSGQPFALAAINETQRRLTGLGLFRRVRISELRHGDETTRDLLVAVEEAPATSIGIGGGIEGRLVAGTSPEGPATDELDLAPRAFFQIGRRNLFGSNRSVNLFTSISLHSTHSSAAGVTEYRFVGTLREPRLFDTAIDAFVNATVEQQVRSSFNFRRRSASAVVAKHLTQSVSATGNYQIQRTSVFDSRVEASDLPLIDRTFTQFLISSFSASIVRDTRDDPVDPAGGTYVSTNGQIAARAIGSEVGFAKSFVTAQAFHALPTARRIVVAANARLGMAGGFDTLGQLPASERFFAGGDTTVRGFALDRLGIRHIPFQPVDTIDSEGLPIGGNGLMVFNAELRSTVRGESQVVGFVDTGQVFARASDIDFTELRSAVGAGIRYKSPVGPIRFDLGFKVHRREGEGLTAWFISFGQAF